MVRDFDFRLRERNEKLFNVHQPIGLCYFIFVTTYNEATQLRSLCSGANTFTPACFKKKSRQSCEEKERDLQSPDGKNVTDWAQDVDALTLQSYSHKDKSLGFRKKQESLLLERFCPDSFLSTSTQGRRFERGFWHLISAAVPTGYIKHHISQILVDKQILSSLNYAKVFPTNGPPSLLVLFMCYHSSMTIPYTGSNQKQASERVPVLTIGLPLTDITWYCTAL
ncbi:hypothetical protein YC2023_116633 [Brassica napus]